MEKIFEKMFSEEFIKDSKKNLKIIKDEAFQKVKNLGIFDESWLKEVFLVDDNIEVLHPTLETKMGTPVIFTGTSAILKHEQVYTVEKVEPVPANPKLLVTLNEVQGKFASEDFKII